MGSGMPFSGTAFPLLVSLWVSSSAMVHMQVQSLVQHLCTTAKCVQAVQQKYVALATTTANRGKTFSKK